MSDQLSADIDTVARAEIVAAIECELDSGCITHEACPDIGAYDWKLVVERIREIIKDMLPDDETRTAAYGRMIDRVGT